MEDNNTRRNNIVSQKEKVIDDMAANKLTREKTMTNKAESKDTNNGRVVAQQAECDQPVSHMVIEDVTNIDRLFRVLDTYSQRLQNIENAVAKNEILVRRYLNYYDISNTIAVATANDPDDPSSPIYQTVSINQILERNADILYVSNDGTSSLYVVVSHKGALNFTAEKEIFPGEVKEFYNIYEIKFRSPALIEYRVSEYKLRPCCSVSQTGAATSAKQDTLLTELQLKADLTETQPVSATSLPLPTGAATSARQDLQPLVATTPVIYNVPMTLADTEYSQALPANTKILEFRNQDVGFATRFAYETGKVAGSVSPYGLLAAGEVKTVEGLNLTSKTLYFACGTAGKILQIECWT